LYSFNFNFIRTLGALSSENYLVHYSNNRTYFNPFETITITCKDLIDWTGASGERTYPGATITKTIKRNNNNLSINSDNQINDSYDLYTASEVTLNYYLTYNIAYNNNEVTPLSSTIIISVPIYRWYEDKHSLTKVSINNNNLKGSLLLPNLLCSQSGVNLKNNTTTSTKEISYSLIDLN